MTFEEFIKFSLYSNTDAEVFIIELKEEVCHRIQKHTGLNIYNYTFIVHESYIRHIKNNHEEDLHLLPRLPEILNSFTHVEKSLTKNSQTGQTDVSLVFRKKIDDNTVQMVALRIMREKTLFLKTFFVKR
jgi:hypothetical protein